MNGKIIGPLRDQSDWAQQNENRLGFIKNKPFYDNRKTEEINFTFEGNPEGHTYYALADSYMFVKVSELAPTIDEASKGMVYATMGDGQVIPQPIARFEENTGGISEEEGYTFLQRQFFVLYKPTTIFAVTIPAGTYMVYDRFESTDIVKISVHIPSVTVGELKTLDPKFLPEESEPKVIDLSGYAGADEQGNIASKILEMLFSGGGENNFWGGNVSKIFEDANTKRVVLLRVPTTETECVILPTIKLEQEGRVAQLTSMGVINMMNNKLTISIFLESSGNGDVSLSVIVKQ